jgi:hypothetical protein
MRLQRWSKPRSVLVRVLAPCVVGVLAGLAVPTAAMAAADGAVATGSMRVAAGGRAVSLVSSSATRDGRLQNQWLVGHNERVTVTAPRGSVVTIGANMTRVTPPLAIPGAYTAGRSSNPCNHCWYNGLSVRQCQGSSCVYGSSDQYAIQEQPGEWYMGQHTTGTVYPGAGSATQGDVWNRFPGESGDSGPLNYQPRGDDCPSSGTSWNWSFSFAGFGFGESGPLSGGSCYGPIAPSGWGFPAFGSRWWSGGQSGNHAVGSGDAIHLGAGQSPYDELDVEAF